MQVHLIETGRLVSNKTFLRSESWSSLLRRRDDFEFPVHSFVLETEDGLVAIDAGLRADVAVPRPQRRFVPVPAQTREIGAQMRAQGIEPGEIATVIVTHLDWDHVGGVAALAHAEILVHRPEFESASTFMGRLRYQPAGWPSPFAPVLYDLDDEPYGPFPRSRRVGACLRVVPLPGHSVGQVGVIAETGGRPLFFVADHMLRVDWFEEDYAAGRRIGLGIFSPDEARETSRRIHEFVHQSGALLVPAHDADTPVRLRDGARVARARTLGA